MEGIENVVAYCPLTGKLAWKIDRKKTKAWSEAGSRHAAGYRQIHYNGKGYLSHRVAWKILHGSWPKTGIDHINGNPSDNRPENLREATQAVNTKNSSLPSHNTSGIIGVHWFKPTNQWTAAIGVNGKSICLGYFNEKSEAAKARKLAEQKYGFHPNHGRKKHAS